MTLVKRNNNPLVTKNLNDNPLITFDRLFSDFWGGTEGYAWSPRTDIVETDKEHQIVVELPGMEKKDISIKVEDRLLVISGEMEHHEETDERRIRRQERFSGSFKRSFRLPAGIETEKINAEFRNGLLTVSLPKSETAVGREIEVK